MVMWKDKNIYSEGAICVDHVNHQFILQLLWNLAIVSICAITSDLRDKIENTPPLAECSYVPFNISKEKSQKCDENVILAHHWNW